MIMHLSITVLRLTTLKISLSILHLYNREHVKKIVFCNYIFQKLSQKSNTPIANRKGRRNFLWFHEIQDYSEEIKYVKIEKRTSPKFSVNSRHFKPTATTKHFAMRFIKKISYSAFHKTLPKSCLKIPWISVRFYEMGDIWTY